MPVLEGVLRGDGRTAPEVGSAFELLSRCFVELQSVELLVGEVISVVRLEEEGAIALSRRDKS